MPKLAEFTYAHPQHLFCASAETAGVQQNKLKRHSSQESTGRRDRVSWESARWKDNLTRVRGNQQDGETQYPGISKMWRQNTWESARCGDRVPGNRQDVETEYPGISKMERQNTSESAGCEHRVHNQQDGETEYLISRMWTQSTYQQDGGTEYLISRMWTQSTYQQDGETEYPISRMWTQSTYQQDGETEYPISRMWTQSTYQQDGETEYPISRMWTQSTYQQDGGTEYLISKMWTQSTYRQDGETVAGNQQDVDREYLGISKMARWSSWKSASLRDKSSMASTGWGETEISTDREYMGINRTG